MTTHYQNEHGVVFGYKAHENLLELSSPELEDIKKQQDLEFQENLKHTEKKAKLYEVNTEISILMNISDRTEIEEMHLQKLLSEAKELYRSLKEVKGEPK